MNVTEYGLADAQREWHHTVSTFLTTIGGVTLVRDQAVFLWYTKRELFRFLPTQVDDFLWAGDDGFEEHVVARLRQKFSIGEEARADLHSVGVHVRCTHGENGYLEQILVDQEDCVDDL